MEMIMIRNNDNKKTGENKQETTVRPVIQSQQVVSTQQPASSTTNQPIPSTQKGNAKMGTFRRLWHLEQ